MTTCRSCRRPNDTDACELTNQAPAKHEWCLQNGLCNHEAWRPGPSWPTFTDSTEDRKARRASPKRRPIEVAASRAEKLKPADRPGAAGARDRPECIRQPWGPVYAPLPPVQVAHERDNIATTTHILQTTRDVNVNGSNASAQVSNLGGTGGTASPAVNPVSNDGPAGDGGSAGSRGRSGCTPSPTGRDSGGAPAGATECPATGRGDQSTSGGGRAGEGTRRSKKKAKTRAKLRLASLNMKGCW